MTGDVRHGGQDRLAQASDWYARLNAAQLSDDEALAFDAWLDAAPGNADAFDDVTATAHAYEAASLQILTALQAENTRRAKRMVLGRRGFLAAGGLAAAAAVALAVLPSTLLAPRTDTYVTGAGEHRTVKLADGSVVDLNARTRLSVTYTRNERRLELAEGEAIFDVAKNPNRPFTVATGGYQVRVVGTQFDVRNRVDGVSVAVARGVVDVRPTEGATAKVYRLVRGQKLRMANAGQPELHTIEPSDAFSWRTGKLVYRGEPLSTVVADLNSQFPEQIQLVDRRLGEMRISGVLVLDNQPDVVQRLTLMLPVSAVPSERGVLLRRR